MWLPHAADALSGMGLLPASNDVLLVDMASYRPPDELRMVMSELKNVGRHWKLYMPETERFATKVLEKSGLSPNNTYLPSAVHPCHTKDPDHSHGTAHYEAEMVMIGAVRDLLDRTQTKPEDVDILITCASIWCATPSQASMLVNHFGFRHDIQSYHLGGMGCATGVLLMSLVKDMLKAHRNSRLLFVASETTTYAFYPGMELSRRVSNVIFRMGGTAVLFSNKWSDRSRAKYRLQHHVRFHTSADDDAYRCISWSPDEEGHLGVYLGKDVADQAGKALTLALTAISPKIMPWGQLAAAAANILQRKVAAVPAVAAAVGMGGPVKAYQPDFGQCVDYFLIHAGGYAVLRGIQSGMRLPAAAMLPSFAALRDYGNTSASTTWYSFTYLETCVGVKRGQRLMQIGCGGGMKCSIAIWQCLRDVRENHKAWRHLDAPLTEADLPRQISEATKLSAALKTVGTTPSAAAAKGVAVTNGTAAAAEVGHMEGSRGSAPAAPPAAAAAAAGGFQIVDHEKKKSEFVGSKLGQVLSVTHSMAADSATAAASAGVNGHQQQQQEEEEDVDSRAGSSSGSSDESSCGSDSDTGNPMTVSSVDSDEAAHVTLSIGPISNSGNSAACLGKGMALVDNNNSSSSGGGNGSNSNDQAECAADPGVQSAPRVAMISEDPEEYEFHL